MQIIPWMKNQRFQVPIMWELTKDYALMVALFCDSFLLNKNMGTNNSSKNQTLNMSLLFILKLKINGGNKITTKCPILDLVWNDTESETKQSGPSDGEGEPEAERERRASGWWCGEGAWGRSTPSTNMRSVRVMARKPPLSSKRMTPNRVFSWKLRPPRVLLETPTHM